MTCDFRVGEWILLQDAVAAVAVQRRSNRWPDSLLFGACRRRLRRRDVRCCRLGSELLRLTENAAAGGGDAGGTSGDRQGAQVVVKDLDAAGAFVARGLEGGQDG